MEKLLESYLQNPMFLKTIVLLMLSFASALFGSVYNVLGIFNKRKANYKKVSVGNRIGKGLESVLTCIIIAISVVSFADHLKYDFLKIMLISIVLGISREGVAKKLNEKDFWEKAIALVFKSKIDILKNFFSKRGPK